MVLWSNLRYSQRLFLWLAGYSVLLVGCFAGFQYHREKEFKASELNSRLQMVNAGILTDISKGMSVQEAVDLQPHVFNGLRISVIGGDGRVVYDNSADSVAQSDHSLRSEVAAALENGSGYTVRRLSESTGSSYFYSATAGCGGLVVRSAVPYSVSLSELLRADMGFLYVMGAVALVMCSLGYIATRRLGLIISRLEKFAEKAEKGERIYGTAPFPKDELGAISGHIVRLYASLQQAVADRDREHQAAMSAQKEKELVKKQLTNNINHELKTPVAAIQVCVETLLEHPDIPDSKRREFLERCLSNASRLKSLLADVSLLTRMDEAPSSVSIFHYDVSAVIAGVVDECLPAATAKGIVISDNVDTPVYVCGNVPLLESVFRNLIDNAIAYSGGSEITVGARLQPDNCVRITVSDNGCGVEPTHLPRLFERFYRVDKGRSRAAGGTGLGLAIVKNAVIIHGGSVAVENIPSGGLCFTITLPLESAR